MAKEAARNISPISGIAVGVLIPVLIPVLIFSAGMAGLLGGSGAARDVRSDDRAASSLPSAVATSAPAQEAPATSTSSPPSEDQPSAADTARNQLAQLRDAPAGYLDGYDRDFFGSAWIDTDRNGCDTRNDILERDLTGIVYQPGSDDCVVLSGQLSGPYIGASIAFTRGTTTSRLVQIDHIVPLAYAWQVGAANWTAERQVSYANDPLNLLAVDGRSNQVKSASGPSAWMPPNQAFQCTYIELFVGVLFEYQLDIIAEDRLASERVLTSCL